MFSLYFRKWNFLALRLKIFLCFLEKKLFVYLWKWHFLKKLLIFQERTFQAQKVRKTYSDKISYGKISFISGGNLQSPKNKNFSHFGKWKFLAPNLKDFLYFIKKISIFNFLH